MLQREVCPLSLIFTACLSPTFKNAVLQAVNEIKISTLGEAAPPGSDIERRDYF